MMEKGGQGSWEGVGIEGRNGENVIIYFKIKRII